MCLYSKRCRRNGKQCRPWSDGSSMSSLIRVYTLRIITVIHLARLSLEWTPDFHHIMLHIPHVSPFLSLQVKQKDIESHSRIVSAVLKHCETLQDDDDVFDHEERRDDLELSAHNLERHWHEIWLQSLEWQCRLEDALSSGKVRVVALCCRLWLW